MSPPLFELLSICQISLKDSENPQYSPIIARGRLPTMIFVGLMCTLLQIQMIDVARLPVPYGLTYEAIACAPQTLRWRSLTNKRERSKLLAPGLA